MIIYNGIYYQKEALFYLVSAIEDGATPDAVALQYQHAAKMIDVFPDVYEVAIVIDCELFLADLDTLNSDNALRCFVAEVRRIRNKAHNLQDAARNAGAAFRRFASVLDLLSVEYVSDLTEQSSLNVQEELENLASTLAELSDKTDRRRVVLTSENVGYGG
jgi:hypothetical protein